MPQIHNRITTYGGCGTSTIHILIDRKYKSSDIAVSSAHFNRESVVSFLGENELDLDTA